MPFCLKRFRTWIQSIFTRCLARCYAVTHPFTRRLQHSPRFARSHSYFPRSRLPEIALLLVSSFASNPRSVFASFDRLYLASLASSLPYRYLASFAALASLARFCTPSSSLASRPLSPRLLFASLQPHCSHRSLFPCLARFARCRALAYLPVRLFSFIGPPKA